MALARVCSWFTIAANLVLYKAYAPKDGRCVCESCPCPFCCVALTWLGAMSANGSAGNRSAIVANICGLCHLRAWPLTGPQQ